MNRRALLLAGRLSFFRSVQKCSRSGRKGWHSTHLSKANRGFGHGGQAVMTPLQRLERQQSITLHHAIIVTAAAGSV
jgi:hypothetical protein